MREVIQSEVTISSWNTLTPQRSSESTAAAWRVFALRANVKDAARAPMIRLSDVYSAAHDNISRAGSMERVEGDLVLRHESGDAKKAGWPDTWEFAQLREVTGSIILVGMRGVRACVFPQLERVGGDVYVRDAQSLKSLAAPRLRHVDGCVLVASCRKLESLDLRQLTRVGGNLRVRDNASLEDLDASFGGSMGRVVVQGKVVELSDNPKLRVLPSAVFASLTDEACPVQTIDLSGCKSLAALPVDLWKFPGTRMELTGCEDLRTPPQVIVAQGLDKVRNYLEEATKEMVAMSMSRLLVVGRGQIGKTSLVRRILIEYCGAGIWAKRKLKKKLRDREESTRGIDIDPLTLHAPDSDVTQDVTLWDFAGQEVYYGTHRYFLSAGRAVYVIVWQGETGDAGLAAAVGHWCRSIAAHGKNASVVVVGTHAYTAKGMSAREGGDAAALRERVQEIVARDGRGLLDLAGSPLMIENAEKSTKRSGVGNVVSTLVQAIQGVADNLGGSVPKTYLVIRARVLKLRDDIAKAEDDTEDATPSVRRRARSKSIGMRPTVGADDGSSADVDAVLEEGSVDLKEGLPVTTVAFLVQQCGAAEGEMTVRTTLSLMHEWGEIVFYGERFQGKVRDLVILDPSFLTKDVMGTVVTCGSVIPQHLRHWRGDAGDPPVRDDGVLHARDLPRVWKDFRAPLRERLLRLLMQFEVLFRFSDASNGDARYLVPALLAHDRTAKDVFFTEPGKAAAGVVEVNREYAMPYAPPGFVSLLIVRSHARDTGLTVKSVSRRCVFYRLEGVEARVRIEFAGAGATDAGSESNDGAAAAVAAVVQDDAQLEGTAAAAAGGQVEVGACRVSVCVRARPDDASGVAGAEPVAVSWLAERLFTIIEELIHESSGLEERVEATVPCATCLRGGEDTCFSVQELEAEVSARDETGPSRSPLTCSRCTTKAGGGRGAEFALCGRVASAARSGAPRAATTHQPPRGPGRALSVNNDEGGPADDTLTPSGLGMVGAALEDGGEAADGAAGVHEAAVELTEEHREWIADCKEQCSKLWASTHASAALRESAVAKSLGDVQLGDTLAAVGSFGATVLSFVPVVSAVVGLTTSILDICGRAGEADAAAVRLAGKISRSSKHLLEYSTAVLEGRAVSTELIKETFEYVAGVLREANGLCEEWERVSQEAADASALNLKKKAAKQVAARDAPQQFNDAYDMIKDAMDEWALAIMGWRQA
jgi:hypothetical protein